MNKKEFLERLSHELRNVPKDERDDILYDYEEHFSVGLEEEKSEEEIAKALGNPESIARSIKAETAVRQAEESKSVGNIWRAVIATIGLGFFNLIFVLGPFLGMVGVLIGFFAASIAIFISGAALFFAAIFSPVLPNLIDVNISPVIVVFLGLGLASLGSLFLIGCGYLTKFLYNATIKYLKINMGIITNQDGEV